MCSSGARALCVLLAAVLFVLGTMEAAAAASKRVILLHSFGREFKPWSEYATTIRDELNRQSRWPLDITEQSVVTARSSHEAPETAFVEYLRALFAKQPPDLIVSLVHPRRASSNVTGSSSSPPPRWCSRQWRCGAFAIPT